MAGDDHQRDPSTTGHGEYAPHPSHGYAHADSQSILGGVTIAANGLRLDTPDTLLAAGVPQEWTFRVRTDEGAIVTAFEETHDRPAHLIVVRRDLTRFQHLHPRLTDDGTWVTKVRLPDPGVYRAFVDLLVNDHPTTLGVDLFVSGDAAYETHLGTTRAATTDDYTVVKTPDTVPTNEPTTLEFEVRHDDTEVTLAPYLGALGHLVALRSGDLAYIHVHPEETQPEDGIVRFTARFPTPGQYRLFFQAQPNGELITTTFDVPVENP